MDNSGSAATKVIVLVVLIGIFVFAGFQAVPLVLLDREHKQFQATIDSQVQAVSALHIPDTQTALSEDITHILNDMGAQFEPHHLQVYIDKEQKKLDVQIWYFRPHNTIGVENPRMFYVRSEKGGFTEVVDNKPVTQAEPVESSQQTALVWPHSTPKPARPTPEPVEYSPPVTLTNANFDQEVLKSPIPVMVDFWATWCGPCKRAAPAVDAAAKEFAGKVKISKLNIDHHKKTASKYGVRGIPTFIIFKDGKRVGTESGFGGQKWLFNFIRTHTSET